MILLSLFHIRKLFVSILPFRIRAILITAVSILFVLLVVMTILFFVATGSPEQAEACYLADTTCFNILCILYVNLLLVKDFEIFLSYCVLTEWTNTKIQKIKIVCIVLLNLVLVPQYVYVFDSVIGIAIPSGSFWWTASSASVQIAMILVYSFDEILGIFLFYAIYKLKRRNFTLQNAVDLLVILALGVVIHWLTVGLLIYYGYGLAAQSSYLLNINGRAYLASNTTLHIFLSISQYEQMRNQVLSKNSLLVAKQEKVPKASNDRTRS
ncbi:hypothetical protein HDV03_000804 [Kappamyces sp. JEL0829]|nr:hypothetical protein HDV03_000804 [Kappamyces sp. JEL0829]